MIKNLDKGMCDNMSMRICTLLTAAGVVMLMITTPSVARDVSKATTPDSRALKGNWWEKRHRQKLAEIAAKSAIDVVFLGDSIINFWEERHLSSWTKWTDKLPASVLNLGFSGDRTENVIWRIQNGELDGYKAKVIVLMVGTNNAGHLKEADEPASNIAAGIRTILDLLRVRQPAAKIVLCAILPRARERDVIDGVCARNLETNVLVRKFCDGKDVIWCDFGNEFLAARGKVDQELMTDYLHPSDAGYEVFGSAVWPVVLRLLEANEAGKR